MSDDDYQRYQMYQNIDRMRNIAERNDPTRGIGYGRGNQSYQRGPSQQVNITITPGIAKALGVIIVGFVVEVIVGNIIARTSLPVAMRLPVLAAVAAAYVFAFIRIARRRRRRRYY